LPPPMPGFNSRLVGYPFDPAKARQLLAVAGYPRGFTCKLWFEAGNPLLEPTAASIQFDLAQVGVQVQLNPVSLPAFLDSPMAIEAGNIYDRHPELYDEAMVAFLKERPLARDLGTLKMTCTPEESKQINFTPGPCLVMAGSGMCTAGRILHHLRLNLGRPETQVLIAGFQGAGTLGRELVQQAKTVVIYGESVPVRAQIHTLNGFSAHAGQTDLLRWFGALAPARPRVVLTHGEDPQRRALAQKILARDGLAAHLPALRETLTL